MKENLYHYRATVVSVYDGDTCTVDIDLGLNTWVRGEKLRLYRINAPELRGVERPEGLKSRDFYGNRLMAKRSSSKPLRIKRVNLDDIWLKFGCQSQMARCSISTIYW